MSSDAQPHRYSRGEELANAVTHGIGVLVAIPAAALLFCRAGASGGGAQAAVAIYGLTLIFMLGASTLYHTVRDVALKARCRKFDHSAIYLLIAGTYTPVLEVAVNSTVGSVILTLIWLFALAGVVFKICFTGRFQKLSIALYLLTGWSGMLILPELLRGLAGAPLWLILSGGVVYSIGVIFYARKRAFSHAGWHLFVLGGALCQYFGIWLIFK